MEEQWWQRTPCPAFAPRVDHGDCDTFTCLECQWHGKVCEEWSEPPPPLTPHERRARRIRRRAKLLRRMRERRTSSGSSRTAGLS